ncbi:MAG: DUF357 domain-containing protein [Methanoregula sp.]|nr:DUF357 domain-containing protein [Methanoregula sp.]
MMLQQCQALLAATRTGTGCCAPEGSPCWRTGQSVLRMAAAYESDGRTFTAAGDPVNALAAFLYGLGWLHCGLASGLLVTAGNPPGCPFTGTFEPVPASEHVKLDEKTVRYARLLDTAIASVIPAPDPGVPSHAFAVQVRFIASLYLIRGNRQAAAGKQVDALACFSYGHGWLDAGVETGLFSILAHREIFTVD